MKKFVFVFVLFTMMLLALTGCGEGAVTPESTDPQGTVQEKSTGDSLKASEDNKTYKIVVAAQPNSGQVFQYLAEDKGYLAEEGVEVEMSYINNATDAFTAMTAGQIDVMSTYGTGGPLIQIANGQEYTIFGGYMIIGETPCFGLPETEWTSLESFRGKTIGITRGGTPDIVLKGILNDAGLLDEVTFVEFKKNQETLQAVANGQVDFGATATGYQLQAEALGLEIKMWPDEYWPNHSCCRMLCNTSYIQDEDNQEALYRMLRAYLRAEKDLNEDKSQVVDLVVENLDLDKATVESFVYSEHMKYDTDPFKNSVVTMWNKMGGFGYLPEDNSIDILEHLNTDIYQRALESLIEDYPDEQFYQDKLTQFNENNL